VIESELQAVPPVTDYPAAPTMIDDIAAPITTGFDTPAGTRIYEGLAIG
jgi:hypothetical protein